MFLDCDSSSNSISSKIDFITKLVAKRERDIVWLVTNTIDDLKRLHKNGDLTYDEQLFLMNGLKQNFNDVKIRCLDVATQTVIAEHQSGEIESSGSASCARLDLIGDLKRIEKINGISGNNSNSNISSNNMGDPEKKMHNNLIYSACCCVE